MAKKVRRQNAPLKSATEKGLRCSPLSDVFAANPEISLVTTAAEGVGYAPKDCQEAFLEIFSEDFVEGAPASGSILGDSPQGGWS